MALKQAMCGFALAALALSGCSSDGENARLDALREGISSALGTTDTTPSTVPPEQIVQTLSASALPVMLLVIDRNQSQTILQEVGRNGRFQTFGNAARQTAIMNRGVLTATQGLGGDLLGSDSDALIEAVTNRRQRTVAYAQRFLTGENKTLTRGYTCEVAPSAQSVPVKAGLIDTTTRRVDARCTDANGNAFDNIYLVTQQGNIVGGRQWAGENLGYLSTQALRL